METTASVWGGDEIVESNKFLSLVKAFLKRNLSTIIWFLFVLVQNFPVCLRRPKMQQPDTTFNGASERSISTLVTEAASLIVHLHCCTYCISPNAIMWL